MKLIRVRDYGELSSEAFRVMQQALSSERPVLGLATGSSPIGLYKKMIADHNSAGTSYDQVLTWNLDEYVGLPKQADQSYWTFMHENLFLGIEIPEKNVHLPSGEAEDLAAECARYEASLQQVQIDLQVLGIGVNGHIGFNEPGTSFDSQTHIVQLTEQTRQDNKRFFGGELDRVPTQAITMGIADIMRARKILLLVSGENKAAALQQVMQGEVSEQCPATILQRHEDVIIIADEAACSRL